MARATTMSVDLHSPFDEVWKFISDPRHLHLWTVGFVIEPPQLKSGDVFVIKTPRGAMDLFVRADQASGVIDFHFGRDGVYRVAPSRIIANGPDACIFIFTQFEPQNAPQGLFETLVDNVRKEFEILAERFNSK